MCMCVLVCIYATCVQVPVRLKGDIGPPGAGLQVVMCHLTWVLGAKIRSSRRELTPSTMELSLQYPLLFLLCLSMTFVNTNNKNNQRHPPENTDI